MNETDRRDYLPVDKVPFTIDHLLAHLQIEADFVVDRVVVTRVDLVVRPLEQTPEHEPLPSGLLPHGRHGRTER